MFSLRYLKPPRIGLLIGTGIFSLICCILLSLIWFGQSLQAFDYFSDPYLWHITQFSVKQALLSTLLSLLGAIPISIALYRRRFMGRTWLLRLCAMTFVLPVLVAVFGIVAIYGNSGLLQGIFAYSGFSIYGLSGILLAHIFFNLPLSVRIITQALQAIPESQHQLASHLGMRAWSRFRFIEWPVIKTQLLSLSSLVFMLCFTSFAIVMALGGGPKATTIELAIYQAIHYDFDLAFGAILGIWQIILTLLFSILFHRLIKRGESHAVHRIIRPIYTPSVWLNLWDYAWILVLALLLLPPLLAVIYSGINTEIIHVLGDASLWKAGGHSLCIAMCSAFFAIVFGISILLTSRVYRLKKERIRANALEYSAMLILVTPSVVLSTGLFLLVSRVGYAADYAMPLVIMVNTLMALPYVVKSLSVPLFAVAQRYEVLCLSLGMKGLRRFYLVEWRTLRQPIRHACGLAFVLSLGDLSAIAMLGSPDFQTLPLYLYRQLGGYQMQAAAVTALVLFLISLGVFFLIEDKDVRY